jgi:transcriptional regulator with GAF, ATPase, and Fis domain
MSRIPTRTRVSREILAAVAQESAIALDDDASVALALGDPSAPTLTVSTDKKAQAFDGAQMDAGEGPSRSAWDEDSTVVAQDLVNDERWPRLAAHARKLPVISAVATPVRIGDQVVGVLSTCAGDESITLHDMVEALELLSSALAAILQESETRDELETLARQLNAALESRAVIEQAKGLVMAHARCQADEAFRALVEMSNRANVKLRTVAQQLVDQVARGEEPDLPLR